ncbi:hypothetical protein J8273_4738 [Carpediemonas membranifera]|uniref:Uncharacterized protein n=1 Tax=Carpediemonas membranifera TaxID=201153 RepID=A0A8J6B425_9EUKA|nr:hypothetical protein J8273_4738 [Carpediemonas membranifera]|eukprot:KAG9393874.1 hypothetical protein J8273_4738 [Carpediemonas membranifera]
MDEEDCMQILSAEMEYYVESKQESIALMEKVITQLKDMVSLQEQEIEGLAKERANLVEEKAHIDKEMKAFIHSQARDVHRKYEAEIDRIEAEYAATVSSNKLLSSRNMTKVADKASRIQQTTERARLGWRHCMALLLPSSSEGKAADSTDDSTSGGGCTPSLAPSVSKEYGVTIHISPYMTVIMPSRCTRPSVPSATGWISVSTPSSVRAGCRKPSASAMKIV